MASVHPETRLLVVDDDSLLRELLGHLLHGTEFRLTDFPSGEQALHFLHEPGARTDAVLMDLQMPGESGALLVGAFRQAAPEALVVGMSARSPRAEESAAFDAFVQKPFDADGLRAALGTAAQNRGRTAGEGSREVEASPSLATRPPDPEPRTCSSSGATGEAPLADAARVLDPGILGKLQASIGAAQLRQLYEMTANDAEARIQRMRQNLVANDQKTLREEAHAIKGGCAMVGAIELSRLAAEAEVSSETDSDDLTEMFEACFRLRNVITIVSP